MTDLTGELPTNKPGRRHWLDSLILGAALAVGIWVAWLWKDVPGSGLWFAAQRAWVMLTMFSLGLVLVRWAGPRPVLAPGKYGPGDAACLGVLVAVGFILLARLPSMLLYGLHFGHFSVDYLRPFLDDRRPAVGVASAWLILRITKGWNPVGDWVDRAGMFSGSAWIALATLVPLANTVWTGR